MNNLIKQITGEVIPFESADISTDIDSFIITARFALPDLYSLQSLKPVKSLRGDYVPVRYDLGNESYNLIVEETYSGDGDYSVSARSITVTLAEPYAQQITHTWRNTTAFDLVTELCNAHGITLDWQITNWHIAEYIAEKRYPIDIINELSEDIGAKVLTLPDGTLWITKYPAISPNKLPEQSPVYELSTATNIFSQSSKFVNRANHNRLLVTTESNGKLDESVTVSIEESKDGADVLIKVFTRPIMPSVTLNHASGDNISVFYEGIKEISQTDDLTFTDGKAQLSKPFHSLDGVIWHQNVIGELSIDTRGNVTTAQALGLATVTYKTRYHQYRIQKVNDIDKTLIAIEDMKAPASLGSLSVELVIGDGSSSANAVVTKTLSNQLALIERGQSELWQQLYDVDSYTLECAFSGVAMQCAKIASVQITSQDHKFNGIIKSSSLRIDEAITQTITIDRQLIT